VTTANAERTATQWIEQGICLAKNIRERKTMCKLTIKQDFNEIELVFDDTVEASTFVEHMIPYVSKQTTFTITSEVEEVKGE